MGWGKLSSEAKRNGAILTFGFFRAGAGVFAPLCRYALACGELRRKKGGCSGKRERATARRGY
jgi:hypothetical protein